MRDPHDHDQWQAQRPQPDPNDPAEIERRRIYLEMLHAPPGPKIAECNRRFFEGIEEAFFALPDPTPLETPGLPPRLLLILAWLGFLAFTAIVWAAVLWMMNR